MLNLSKIMTKIERQLRWNVISNENPTRHQFYFLIINDNRGANRIEQNTKVILQPTEDMHSLTEGAIPGSKIRYKLLEFTSYRQNLEHINWPGIYSKKTIRDKNLYQRQETDGLAKYVESLIQNGQIS